MHALRIAADERVPGGEAAPLVQAAIGAGGGHPGEVLHLMRGELDAVGHELFPLGVVGAAAALRIKQLAGDVGGEHLSGLLVLEAHQTAAPAAVAEAFPLLLGHLPQSFDFPEGFLRHLHRVTPMGLGRNRRTLY